MAGETAQVNTEELAKQYANTTPFEALKSNLLAKATTSGTPTQGAVETAPKGLPGLEGQGSFSPDQAEMYRRTPEEAQTFRNEAAFQVSGDRRELSTPVAEVFKQGQEAAPAPIPENQPGYGPQQPNLADQPGYGPQQQQLGTLGNNVFTNLGEAGMQGVRDRQAEIEAVDARMAEAGPRPQYQGNTQSGLSAFTPGPAPNGALRGDLSGGISYTPEGGGPAVNSTDAWFRNRIAAGQPKTGAARMEQNQADLDAGRSIMEEQLAATTDPAEADRIKTALAFQPRSATQMDKGDQLREARQGVPQEQTLADVMKGVNLSGPGALAAIGVGSKIQAGDAAARERGLGRQDTLAAAAAEGEQQAIENRRKEEQLGINKAAQDLQEDRFKLEQNRPGEVPGVSITAPGEKDPFGNVAELGKIKIGDREIPANADQIAAIRQRAADATTLRTQGRNLSTEQRERILADETQRAAQDYEIESNRSQQTGA